MTKTLKDGEILPCFFLSIFLSLGVLVNQVTGSHAQPCNITQCCNITGNRLSIQHVPVVLTQVPPVCFMANASCCWPRKKVVVVGAPRQRKREPMGSQVLARMGVLTNRRKGKRKKKQKTNFGLYNGLRREFRTGSASGHGTLLLEKWEVN